MISPMESPRYFSGQFLLSTPGMGDPRFSRSVIALCSHDENGALGINIGKRAESVSFPDILNQLNMEHDGTADIAIYSGGPVEPERGFILHSLDMNLSDTLQVGTRWGLTSNLEMLREIAQGGGPERAILALGYSGWGEGQLESELTRNGWSLVEGDENWIFESESKDKWEMVWQAQGIDPNMLSGDIGSA